MVQVTWANCCEISARATLLIPVIQGEAKMTTLMLFVFVALEALVGALLYYRTSVNLNTNTMIVIGVATFFLGLFPAVQIDSHFPWCPKCHSPWSGRRLNSDSAPPEERRVSEYHPDVGAFEKKTYTVYQESASYFCSRCGHRFNQSWTTRQPL